MTMKKGKMGEISARVRRHLQVVVLAASSLHCTSLHGSINQENLKGSQVRKYGILEISSNRTKRHTQKIGAKVSIPVLCLEI
jgi:hypothetical protein